MRFVPLLLVGCTATLSHTEGDGPDAAELEGGASSRADGARGELVDVAASSSSPSSLVVVDGGGGGARTDVGSSSGARSTYHDSAAAPQDATSPAVVGCAVYGVDGLGEPRSDFELCADLPDRCEFILITGASCATVCGWRPGAECVDSGISAGTCFNANPWPCQLSQGARWRWCACTMDP